MLQIKNAKTTPATDVTQSIYVTVAERQTIAQASVYYLIELTSLGSENSLYFIPTSVVASNGRYTKMTFTVIDPAETAAPTGGRIKFYDAVGKYDTYPMGFYTYKIYEQTSSSNLDPALATKELQEGMAYVYDFSGNMQEVSSAFKEYEPTTTQYVYP
jgi:hypothetical protein